MVERFVIVLFCSFVVGGDRGGAKEGVVVVVGWTYAGYVLDEVVLVPRRSLLWPIMFTEIKSTEIKIISTFFSRPCMSAYI